MDDAPPSPQPSAAKAKNPVADLQGLISEFEAKMLEAQVKQFDRMKKGLAKLLVAPAIIRISDASYVLESFENPDAFFNLQPYDEGSLAKYEQVFGKGKSAEQVREILDVAQGIMLCMHRIGFFAAKKITEVRIVP